MNNSTERHEEKIVDAFVLKGVYGTCLITSTLLFHRLQTGNVIEGYLVFDDVKSNLRHYWCSIDEVNHDLCSIIEAGFRQYTTKSKIYWKKAPRWIRALKGS